MLVSGVFSSVHYLYSDFSLDSGLSNDEKRKSVTASVILGLRLAAAFFFQSGVNILLNTLAIIGRENDIHTFTLENVADLVVSRLGVRSVALLWHFDEFHHLDHNLLKDLMRTQGHFMTSQKYPQISISPLFSGTSSRYIAAAVRVSNLQDITIFLQVLERAQSDMIVAETLKGYPQLDQNLREQALQQLGDWPRFLDLFCENFVRSISLCSVNIEDYVGLVLRRTRDSIKSVYSLESWQMLMGGDHKESLHNMCLWALSRQRVALSDKLNGLTVASVRDLGILMLTPAGSEGGKGTYYYFPCFLPSPTLLRMSIDLYYIEVPLLLIRALNDQGNFMDPITEQLFDPRVSNEHTFEDQIVGMRILRGNMLARKRSTCTVAELYPGAIGHREDLQRHITIKHTGFGRVAGASSGNRTEIVDYDVESVPLVGGNKCNMKTGEIVAVNVPRAPSFDALTFHPPQAEKGKKVIPALWELLQLKSSDNIRDGKAIDPTSTAVLFTNIIKAERDKIDNQKHNTFYGGVDTLLVIVSNKPLAYKSGSM